MNIKRTIGIAAGIAGTLLGGVFMALAIKLLTSDLRHPDWKGHGVWISALLPGLPLLIGGIGTLIGSKLFAWLLFLSNTGLLLWAIGITTNVKGWMRFSLAQPEGLFLLAAVVVEATAGAHLFWKAADE